MKKGKEETKKREEKRKKKRKGKGKNKNELRNEGKREKGIRELVNDYLTDDMEARRTPCLSTWTRKRAAHNNSLLQWRGSVSS